MTAGVFHARRGRSHGAAVGMGGSARDGQLSPRVTREGWPATVSYLVQLMREVVVNIGPRVPAGALVFNI